MDLFCARQPAIQHCFERAVLGTKQADDTVRQELW